MGTIDPLTTAPLNKSAGDKSAGDTSEVSQDSFLVLVVDDSIDNLTALSLNLQLKGYRVATASNGEEALKIAPLIRPNLIVMDLAMPGIDGLESTRRIREDAALRDVPVIALTAFSTGGFQRAAYDTGFDGYLTKPVDFDRLHDLIRRLIALAQSNSQRSPSSGTSNKS